MGVLAHTQYYEMNSTNSTKFIFPILLFNYFIYSAIIVKIQIRKCSRRDFQIGNKRRISFISIGILVKKYWYLLVQYHRACFVRTNCTFIYLFVSCHERWNFPRQYLRHLKEGGLCCFKRTFFETLLISDRSKEKSSNVSLDKCIYTWSLKANIIQTLFNIS